MCLSTVYKGSEPVSQNILAEYVTNLNIMDGQIDMTDITGEALTVRGSLRSVDLVSNRIFLDLE